MNNRGHDNDDNRIFNAHIKNTAAPVVPADGNSLYQSAARMNAAVTRYVGAVQDALSGEARSSLFSNIPNIVTGRMTARDAVEQAMRLN